MIRKHGNNDSFTLIEIIIVLVIMSIVGVITIPRITTAIESVRFRGVISEFVTFLRKAHLEAILERKDIVVTVDFGENTLKMDDDKQYTLPPEIMLEPERQDNYEVTRYKFFKNGRGTGPKIYLIGNDKREAIVYVDSLSGLSGYDLR